MHSGKLNSTQLNCLVQLSSVQFPLCSEPATSCDDRRRQVLDCQEPATVQCTGGNWTELNWAIQFSSVFRCALGSTDGWADRRLPSQWRNVHYVLRSLKTKTLQKLITANFISKVFTVAPFINFPWSLLQAFREHCDTERHWRYSTA